MTSKLILVLIEQFISLANDPKDFHNYSTNIMLYQLL